MRVKYFVTKGPASKPRHYWQPSKSLIARGLNTERLDDDLDIAMGQAFALTQRLSKWRLDNMSEVNATTATKFHDLLTAWISSQDYVGLSSGTKNFYRSGLKPILSAFGTMDSQKITSAMVNDLKNKFSHQPGKAAQVVRTGQAATSWAIRAGYAGAPKTLDLNPWAKQRLDESKAEPVIWSGSQIDHMVNIADEIDPSLGTAILLMEWLGQYPGDIIALTWSCYKNTTFRFKRKKTGASITVDASPRIKARLMTEKIRQPLSTYILAARHTGKPWTLDNFRKHFRKIRAVAAWEDLTVLALTMGKLRHTAVTNMFDAGINPMDIAAITGHKLNSVMIILDRYNKRTEKQAKRAVTGRLKQDTRHSQQI